MAKYVASALVGVFVGSWVVILNRPQNRTDSMVVFLWLLLCAAIVVGMMAALDAVAD